MFNLIFKSYVLSWGFVNIIVYYVFLPASWQFFLGFQSLSQNKFINLYFEAKIKEYLDFYISLYYTVLVNFQLFVLMFIFFKYSGANLKLIKKSRKLSYFFFVSTLLTPPDVFSQLTLSLIFILLYELFIFYSIVVQLNLFK